MGCGGSKPPPSPPPVERTASDLDLDNLLNADEGIFSAFEKFASEEHSQENLLFLKAVKTFRVVAGNETPLSEDASKQAAAIIDTFLWKRAKSKVNLPGDELAAFVDRSDHGKYKYNAMMFDAAYERIYKLIKDDTFRRFTFTDSAHELSGSHPSVRSSRPASEAEEAPAAS